MENLCVYDMPKNLRTFLKCCRQTVVGERVLITSSVGPPVVSSINDHHGGAPPLFMMFVVCAPIFVFCCGAVVVGRVCLRRYLSLI